MLHGLANDGGFVALKWTVRYGDTERRRQKPAVQQKTTDDSLILLLQDNITLRKL